MDARLREDERMMARLEARLEALERDMRTAENIPVAVFDAYTKLRETVEKDQARRIDALEEAQTWAFRLVAASFVGIVVEAVVIILRTGAH